MIPYTHLRWRWACDITMWWLRLVGSWKLKVSFAKKPYKRDYILQKRPIIWRSLLIVAIPYWFVRCANKDTVPYSGIHQIFWHSTHIYWRRCVGCANTRSVLCSTIHQIFWHSTNIYWRRCVGCANTCVRCANPYHAVQYIRFSDTLHISIGAGV